MIAIQVAIGIVLAALILKHWEFVKKISIKAVIVSSWVIGITIIIGLAYITISEMSEKNLRPFIYALILPIGFVVSTIWQLASVQRALIQFMRLCIQYRLPKLIWYSLLGLIIFGLSTIFYELLKSSPDNDTIANSLILILAVIPIAYYTRQYRNISLKSFNAIKDRETEL